MESSQGYVAWTDAAYAEDAGYRSMTRMGHLALAIVLGACVVGRGRGIVAKK